MSALRAEKEDIARERQQQAAVSQKSEADENAALRKQCQELHEEMSKLKKQQAAKLLKAETEFQVSRHDWSMHVFLFSSPH